MNRTAGATHSDVTKWADFIERLRYTMRFLLLRFGVQNGRNAFGYAIRL